ncbi:MAG: hypothetical protein HY788_13250 [Deltaproteobacteria bacterium]|nr:hypothetical protein [Deltaproteobacteria bacterium]
MRLKNKYFFPLALLSILVSVFTAVWLVLFWHALSPTEKALFEHLFINRFAQILIIGSLSLCALAFALGALLHYYLIPLRRLTEETHLITTVNPSHRVALKGAKDIRRLAAAINQGADRFEEVQRRIRSIVHRGKFRLEEEKSVLEAILAQLTDGVLLSNNGGRITFYNERARELLSPVNLTEPASSMAESPVGLGRSIFDLVDSNRLISAIDTLDSSPSLEKTNPVRSFASESPKGRRLIVKVAPAWDSQRKRIGYVLILNEASSESGSGEIHGQEDMDRRPANSGPPDLHLPISGPLSAVPGLGSESHSRGNPSAGFYDFDLFAQAENHTVNGDRPLAELAYTVFDTETTGLYPWDGDEIISIGAVRIINARLLQDDVFHRLIDPRRIIRTEAMNIHGIRPEMLKGCPTIDRVLPLFQKFVEDSVLVGHNVGFDMRFLQMKEEATGIRFNNPILDTMMLSAVVHPNQEAHSLEALGSRLGVDPVERHSALGDALTTGRILIRLIRLLDEKGIKTLGQAIKASRDTYYSRIRY